jgi:hypothetical protein
MNPFHWPISISRCRVTRGSSDPCVVDKQEILR